jgi:PBP1b-binding outer membrane lipoprotein LpoB
MKGKYMKNLILFIILILLFNGCLMRPPNTQTQYQDFPFDETSRGDRDDFFLDGLDEMQDYNTIYYFGY